MDYQKITVVKEPRLQYTEDTMEMFIAKLKDPAKSFHGRISQRIECMKSSGGNIPIDYIRTRSNISKYYYPFGLEWNEANTMDFDSCLDLFGGLDLMRGTVDPLGMSAMNDFAYYDDEIERDRLETIDNYPSNKKEPLKPNMYKSKFYVNLTHPDNAGEKESNKSTNPMIRKMKQYDILEYAFSVLSRSEKPAFQKCIFMKHFEPSEIEVNVSAENIMINAKHEERLDEHGYITRTFSRIIPIPSTIDPNSILPVIDRIGCLKILGRESKAASGEESCKDLNELKVKLQESPQYIHDEPDENILHYRNNNARLGSGFARFSSDNLPLTPDECRDVVSEIDEDLCLENSDRLPVPKGAKTRAFAEAEKFLESMHPQMVCCLKYAGADVKYPKKALKYNIERAACLERILYNRKKILEVTSYVLTREEFFVDPFILEKFQKCFNDISKYVKIYLAYRFEIAYIIKNDLMGDLEFLKKSSLAKKMRHLNYRSDTRQVFFDIVDIVDMYAEEQDRTSSGDSPSSVSATSGSEPEWWQTNSLSRASDIVPDTSEFTTLSDRLDGNICRTSPGHLLSSTSGDDSNSSSGASDFDPYCCDIGPRTPPGF